MSLFAFAFTQEAFLHRYTGINDDGDAQYEPALTEEPVSFLCRLEPDRKEVLDKDGNRVISEAALYTLTELHPLDIINCEGQEWTVISCAPERDPLGRFDHWEARLGSG